MVDWWPLTELACRPASDQRRVAWQGDAWVTHAQFVARVDAWQMAFEAQPDVRQWAIYLDDPVAFAAAVLAAWHAGKVVVLPGDDRPQTLAALQAEGCGLAGDLPGGLQAFADEPGARAEGLALLRSGRRAIDVREARLKVYTSGSQGQPEAIEKRLFQLVSEVEALEAAFGGMLAAADAKQSAPTVWATVSHQHIYGLLFLVLWPLAAARPLAAKRLLYPEDMAACLGPKPSVLVTTPAHLKRLGDQLDWGNARQGLRAVFSSGGPLPFDVSRDAAAALGHTPIEVFGSSETGGIAWRQCAQADTPWQPFADVEWQIEDACLAVRSPRLPDAQWWVSSDRVEAAGAHGFKLLGRADRIVKIEEKRVSLSFVEQQVLRTPWVKEARALVVNTPIGARVAVVAVPTAEGWAQMAQATGLASGQGRRALATLLRQTLADSLEPMALPKRWRFVDALPVNAQGKTPEAMLLDLFTMNLPEMPAVEWLNRSDAEVLAALDIHAGLSVFDGHFPASPILPGVAQLDWTLALARDCFALPEHFVRLEALKFVRPVQPGTRLMLSLQFKPRLANPALCSVTFKLFSQAETQDQAESIDHASGRAVWSYEDGPVHA
jgi:acyl-coenzyme A synthetase/AMP-(fatty) acid ligase